MRRVQCRVCREWFSDLVGWTCPGACTDAEKKRISDLESLSRNLDSKRQKDFQQRLNNAGKKRELTAKKQKTKKRLLGEKLARLMERENKKPSSSRRLVIQKLVRLGAELKETQVRLAKATEKVRVLKQERPLNGFYETRAWQELRYRALRHWGRTCMLCGVSGCELHVDHIKPRSTHPDLELSFENLQVLCRTCNMGKSNKDDTDWRPGA